MTASHVCVCGHEVWEHRNDCRECQADACPCVMFEPQEPS